MSDPKNPTSYGARGDRNIIEKGLHPAGDDVARGAAKARVDGYLGTIDRMEPDIHPVDAAAYYASTSISLKRIADSLEKIAAAMEPSGLPFLIQDAITRGLFEARR